jgi:HSP20 family protein
MSLTRWEPFKDLMTLREAMDRLFEDSFVRTGPRWVASGESGCDLPVDAYVTDEELVVTASVPGIDPEDVDITIEGDTLTIKGALKTPPDNVDHILQERPCGKFQRTLRLNIPVQADKAEATFERGILTLVIPKQEEVKPKTITVKAK